MITLLLLVPVKWLTGKTISDMTYIVLRGTLNLNQPAPAMTGISRNFPAVLNFGEMHWLLAIRPDRTRGGRSSYEGSLQHTNMFDRPLAAAVTVSSSSSSSSQTHRRSSLPPPRNQGTISCSSYQWLAEFTFGMLNYFFSNLNFVKFEFYSNFI